MIERGIKRPRLPNLGTHRVSLLQRVHEEMKGLLAPELLVSFETDCRLPHCFSCLQTN